MSGQNKKEKRTKQRRPLGDDQRERRPEEMRKIEKTDPKELMEKSLSRMEGYRKQWEQLWKEREENTEKEEKGND